jgi:hypothetical protein
MTLPYLDSEKRKELVKHKAKTLSRYKHLLSTLFTSLNPFQRTKPFAKTFYREHENLF